MRFPAKILFTAISCAVGFGPVTPAIALMPAPSYSQALNTVNASPPVEEIRHGRRHKRHAKRYDRRHGKYRYGHRRYGKRYGKHRRYRPRIGIYIAPPPIYITPRVYAAPRVYRAPRNQCNYWASQCAANWSTRSDYLGCMRYEGCY